MAFNKAFSIYSVGFDILIPSRDQRYSDYQRKDDLIKLLTVIIENTTLVPFRWHSNGYMCFYCGRPLEDHTTLKHHNKEEHSDVKIRSAYKSLLRRSKVKFDMSEAKCKLCAKPFLKIDDLLEHLKNAHDLKFNVSLKNEVSAFKLAEEKLQCQDCGEEFMFFGTLLRHSHAYHNKSASYVCEICGMAFVARENVNAHIKNVHYKDAPCAKCSKTDCIHKHPKNFKCPKCPQVFTSKHLKKSHLAKIHDVKRFQFQCDQCPRVFLVRNRLLLHKQGVHLKQHSYSCEFCGYRTHNRDYLKRHMISHNDARPFECDFCKKTFQRKKTLEFHKRIHTNDKRYVCNVCGKAFVQTTSLKLHYRVHHSIDTSRGEDRN